MAINLATKYSDKIATWFTHASFLKGRGNNDYSFEGVKTVKIYTPVTVDLTDYTRSGANRYGTPTEMQDTVQEMTMTQDKSFALTIDKGNNAEQMNIKSAMKMLRLEIDDKVIPAFDKYVLAKLAVDGGICKAASAVLSKSNITETLANALADMDNALVPPRGRTILIKTTNYNLLRLSPEFTSLEKLGNEALANGQVGEFMGARVVKLPDSYFPAHVNFIISVDKAFTAPWKINDTRVHKDPPGLSGDLLEGRFMWDCFVIGAKADGVYVGGTNTAGQQAAPTITVSSGNATIASSGATSIKYTLDGTDPRYSESANVYSAAVAVTSGTVIKAVAYNAVKLTSTVATTTAS